MLYYSFSTVLMTILASNFLIILISLCFQNDKLMVTIGYKLLAVFAIFTLLRLLLPFEFPFSNNIILPVQLSEFIASIRQPFYQIGRINISIWFLFEVVWVIGIFIELFFYCKKHVWLQRFISHCGHDVTDMEPYAGLLSRTCPTPQKIHSFRVIKLPFITVPMYYSFRTHYIILPQNIRISDEDMFYIFRHELSHHTHRDLWIKNAIQMLTIIYWWNPFCLLLKKSTDIILEMRVDSSLTQSDGKVTTEYLHCLVHMAEFASMPQAIPKYLSVSFSKGSSGTLEKRFNMLCIRKKPFPRILSLLITGIILTVYITSYIFIFEASHIPQNIEGISLSPENTYAVISENGTYDIYFNDILVENVDNLELYPDDIHIYTIKEKENYYEED